MIESLLAGLFLLSALGLVGGAVYLFWRLRTAGRVRPPASPDGGLGATLFSALALVVLVAGAIALQLPRVSEPQPSLVVKLTGYQFGWKFEYFESDSAGRNPETPLRSLGVSTTDLLVVPRGGILVLATSSDVVHRLEIPSLQVRKDLIPGLVSSFPLNTQQTGEFVLLSDGLCGAALNLMVAKLTVLEPSLFRDWLDQQGVRVAAGSGPR